MLFLQLGYVVEVSSEQTINVYTDLLLESIHLLWVSCYKCMLTQQLGLHKLLTTRKEVEITNR